MLINYSRAEEVFHFRDKTHHSGARKLLYWEKLKGEKRTEYMSISILMNTATKRSLITLAKKKTLDELLMKYEYGKLTNEHVTLTAPCYDINCWQVCSIFKDS